mgnify:CR=1 FL=1|jgi:hypothetical protein
MEFNIKSFKFTIKILLNHKPDFCTGPWAWAKKNNMTRLLWGIKAYFSDWENWVVHCVVGVILLLFLLSAPLDPVVRIAVLLCVVAFNIIRMKYFDKSKKASRWFLWDLRVCKKVFAIHNLW